jgi:hypothetical protein
MDSVLLDMPTSPEGDCGNDEGIVQKTAKSTITHHPTAGVLLPAVFLLTVRENPLNLRLYL